MQWSFILFTTPHSCFSNKCHRFCLCEAQVAAVSLAPWQQPLQMSVNKLQNVFLRIDKPTTQQPSNQLHLMSVTHTRIRLTPLPTAQNNRAATEALWSSSRELEPRADNGVAAVDMKRDENKDCDPATRSRAATDIYK